MTITIKGTTTEEMPFKSFKRQVLSKSSIRRLVVGAGGDAEIGHRSEGERALDRSRGVVAEKAEVERLQRERRQQRAKGLAKELQRITDVLRQDLQSHRENIDRFFPVLLIKCER